MKIKISVAVACFLPGRAKELSAPRYYKEIIKSDTCSVVDEVFQ